MMKLVSLNLRGLGDHGKFLSVSNFFSACKPTFIFIQETMHPDDCVILYFRKMFPDWHLSAKSAEGRSGGLVAMWNPRWASMKAFSFFGGILLSGFCRGFQDRIHLINIYAPYLDRKDFWQRMDDCGLLSLSNLLIAGDFNCALCDKDVWGPRGRRDPLADDITGICNNAGLCDIQFKDSGLTWLNGRSGQDFIGKKIDRFVISNGLRVRMLNWRQMRGI